MGTVTSAMVDAAGISRGNLQYLAATGRLERTSRGVYILPEIWEDELYAVQIRFRREYILVKQRFFFGT